MLKGKAKDIASIEGFAAMGVMAVNDYKKGRIIEKIYSNSLYEKFLCVLPVLVSIVISIMLVILGYNSTMQDKKEIVAGRYETVSAVLSAYKDLGGQLNEYDFYDLKEKGYYRDSARIVLPNSDEIEFDMYHSKNITDEVDYNVIYKHINSKDLEENAELMVNDMISRTAAMQQRSVYFKQYLHNSLESEYTTNLDENQKQELVNKLIDVVKKKEFSDLYKTQISVLGKRADQYSYIIIDKNYSGYVDVKFTVNIEPDEEE